ncbi:hypothetical protein [Sphingomonas sp. MMS24-J13]|uniref:DNA polymerase III subunit beta n=1 Tax=Sphingomonas sp. MMS24-J13 TaxID=3238686 RepID=UPI00384C61BE
MADASIALPTQDFRHLIAIATMPLERRSSIPILSMVRCRANGSFEVTGTDLDITVSAKFDHGGGPEGSFMLAKPRSVAEAARGTGAHSVELTLGDSELGVTAGALTMKVGNLPPVDDFPSLGEMAHETFTSTMSHAQLRSLHRIAASVSTEETRYYLNGIYLHQIAGTHFRAAATNGHRLSVIDLELPDARGELPGIIIPRKSLRLMLALAGKPSPKDEGLRLAVGGINAPNRTASTAPERSAAQTRMSMQIRAGKVDVCLATKLIDGTYPDYQRVIPQPGESTKTFVFESAELRRAISALSHVVTDEARGVKVSFDTEGALLSAQILDVALSSSIRVGCQHKHAGFEVGFNGGYLLSMIDAAGPGELVLSLDDPVAPALMRNPADTAWNGVLMPMRV